MGAAREENRASPALCERRKNTVDILRGGIDRRAEPCKSRRFALQSRRIPAKRNHRRSNGICLGNAAYQCDRASSYFPPDVWMRRKCIQRQWRICGFAQTRNAPMRLLQSLGRNASFFDRGLDRRRRGSCQFHAVAKEQQIGARNQRLDGRFDRSVTGQRVHLEAIRDEDAVEAKARPKEIG